MIAIDRDRGFDAENETMTEYVQTRWYRAPELLCDSPHYGRVSPSAFIVVRCRHCVLSLLDVPSLWTSGEWDASSQSF
jgi:hypothetical protein